jgi:hypothetical protein
MSIFGWQITPSETNATSVVQDGIRSLCLWICQFIYKLFAFFYELFMNMTQVQILQQPDIEALYKRVTILLGLVMLFVSIFNLLKLLLTPDKINDKEMGIGSLIKRAVVVVLLIGFTPSIFNLATDIQQEVVKSDVIPKILLGQTFSDENGSSDTYAATYGRVLSAKIFTIFYKYNDQITTDDACLAYQYLETEMANFGTLNSATACVNVTGDELSDVDSNDTITAYVIDFDGIGAIIVGVVMLWMIIVYTIDLGIRTIQFTFLQIIAPIPIISYIYPKKDGMFQKWVKQCITTYVDIFIRLAAIYFVFYLVQLIWDADVLDNIASTTDHRNWICIILTIALMIFARRLPKILQELSGKPNAASIGFGIGKNSAAAMTLKGGFTGLAGGGPIGMVRGMNRAAELTTEEGKRGAERAMNETREKNRIRNQQRMEGMRLPSRARTAISHSLGRPDFLERQAYQYQLAKQIKDEINDDDDVKRYQRMLDSIDPIAGGYTDSSGRVLYTETQLKNHIKQARDQAYKDKMDTNNTDAQAKMFRNMVHEYNHVAPVGKRFGKNDEYTRDVKPIIDSTKEVHHRVGPRTPGPFGGRK